MSRKLQAASHKYVFLLAACGVKLAARGSKLIAISVLSKGHTSYLSRTYQG